MQESELEGLRTTRGKESAEANDYHVSLRKR